MAIMKEPRLKVKAMIPLFQLMSADGKTVSVWDYKGFQNLAIIFLPSDRCDKCKDFINQINQSYHRYAEEQATPIVIIRGTREDAVSMNNEVKPPFPILFDNNGNVTAQYTDTLPAVFVADRFGELYAEWLIGKSNAFPSQKEIMDVIELINLECPECGAPLDWR